MDAARHCRFLVLAAALLAGCGKERVIPVVVDGGTPVGWDEPTEANGYRLVPPAEFGRSSGYQSSKRARAGAGAGARTTR